MMKYTSIAFQIKAPDDLIVIQTDIVTGTMIFKTNNFISPYADKLIYLNLHPLEVVSRYRDPQLQVGEN